MAKQTKAERDPDSHLIGTPWDVWRSEVASLLGCSPVAVSRMADAYPAFNGLESPKDFAADYANGCYE